jgi:hypothetical protein
MLIGVRVCVCASVRSTFVRGCARFVRGLHAVHVHRAFCTRVCFVALYVRVFLCTSQHVCAVGHARLACKNAIR